MKSLLINAGIGWCGTSPLFRTLCRSNDYCIKTKEFHKEPDILTRVEEGRLPLSHYIDYLNSLPGERVTDFSNSNAYLSEEFLEEIAPELKSHFDVKCTIIYRDPVKQYYSMTVHDHSLFQKTGTIIEYFRERLRTENPPSYIRTYRNYAKHFPTYPIVMENLWSHETQELLKLSQFLNYPLRSLYPNVYHDGVLHEGLEDQWTDQIPINRLDYRIARSKLSWMYDEWEKEFDNMPW